MKILHQALGRKVNPILESQQTPYTSPSRASYGVYIVRILEKIDRVIPALHCIYKLIWIIFIAFKCPEISFNLANYVINT